LRKVRRLTRELMIRHPFALCASPLRVIRRYYRFELSNANDFLCGKYQREGLKLWQVAVRRRKRRMP
jgi:hypothetical protein